MSAWTEWQMALKQGDMEQAELSYSEYCEECRREAYFDAHYYDEADVDDADDEDDEEDTNNEE